MNLNNTYYNNKELKIPELNNITILIGSNNTPYLKTGRGNRKLGFLQLPRSLIIDIQDHTLIIKSYDQTKNKFDYSITKQTSEVPT